MNPITLNIGDLPGDEKRSLEQLMHQRLEGGQQIFIMTYRPGDIPSGQNQRRSQRKLSHALDAAQKHAVSKGISAEQADEAVDEAMRTIRPRKR